MATTEVPRLMRLASKVASFGLREPESEPIVVPDRMWSAFLGALAGQRLIGLAVAALESGQMRLNDGQKEQLLDQQRVAMLRCLTIERKLLLLVAAFEDAGVDLLVLKGPALAHTVYPDPAWRPFGDLDLLVRTRDWRLACEVLAGLGLRRRLPEPRRGFDEQFGKAAVYTDEAGLEVDLHRTLAPGPFGLWVEIDELFDRAATFELGLGRLRRLDDTGQLLHACLHATLGWWPPQLWTLRDVGQIACYADVQWGALSDWARRWRLGLVLQRAFEAVSEILEVSVPAEATSLMGTDSTRRERRLLEAYTTSRRSRGGIAMSTIRAIPTLRSKAFYIRALLIPDRQFQAARSGDAPRASYVRRWLIPIRWLITRGRTRLN